MEGHSRNAIISAMARGLHLLTDPDPIFEGRFALSFAVSENDAVEFARVPAASSMSAYCSLCQRSRFVEEQGQGRHRARRRPVRRAGCGTELICLAQNGFDAAPTPVEVDHPATQEHKHTRFPACPAWPRRTAHPTEIEAIAQETGRRHAQSFDRAALAHWVRRSCRRTAAGALRVVAGRRELAKVCRAPEFGGGQSQ